MTGAAGGGLAAAPITRPSLTPDAICSQLAERFGVQVTEVGLLRVKGSTLRFIFPRELARVGPIPLNSTAVAARTARTRRPELSNDFANVPHWSMFESVPLYETEKSAPMAIQKLISVPIISPNDAVLGVIQISRKGATRQSAGPDFSPDDLQRLKLAAAEISGFISLLSVAGVGR